MKQKLYNLVKTFRKNYIFSLTLLLMAIVFGMPAQAGIIDGILSVLASIFGLLSMAVGSLLAFLLQILVNVAQFNNFIYVEPVVYGWVVVRDICNMFFIVVLLIIAFATILQINGYDWKKDVPKLVIAAILINFSKMFAGLMIDISQVIMLTFVNAFAVNGANNLALAFQIQKYNSFSNSLLGKGTPGAVSSYSFQLLLAAIAGFAAACIATVIVIVMIIALVMRIVMLWIYVILSPLPYLLGTFEKGKIYANKWWGEFTKELIGGPVLAFFLWLALTVAKMDANDLLPAGNNTDKLFTDPNAVNEVSRGLFMSGGTDLFTNGPFQKYLIVIGLMVGGLKIAGEAGGTMGDWAKKGSSWVNSGANLSKKMAFSGMDFINRKQAKFTGQDLNIGRRVETFKKGFADRKEKDLQAIKKRAGDLLAKGGATGAILGTGADSWMENYFGLRGIKRVMGDSKGKPLTDQSIQSMKDAKDAAMGGDEWNKETARMMDETLQPELMELTKKRAEIEAAIIAKEEEGTIAESEGKTKESKKLRDEREALIAQQGEIDEKIENTSNLKNQKREEIYNKRADEHADLEKRNLLFNDKDKLVDFKQGKILEANKLSEEAAKYRVDYTKDEQNFRAAISAQSKNVTSQNEDELIMQFEGALANNNTDLAAAIFKQIAKVGGMNALVQSRGYNDTAGMSPDEIKDLKSKLAAGEIKDQNGNTLPPEAFKSIYAKERGFNDFVRDTFGEKLGMSERNYLMLQSDTSELNPGHGYMEKTVGVDKYGKLEQNSGLKRSQLVLGERNKTEVESNIRNKGRLWYGDESSGHYRFNNEGLAYVAANWTAFLKELENGKRINASSVASWAQPYALNQLTKALQKNVDMGLMQASQAATMVKLVEEQGKSKRKDTRDTVQLELSKDFDKERFAV